MNEQLLFVNLRTGNIYQLQPNLWGATEIFALVREGDFLARRDFPLNVRPPLWKNRNTFDYFQMLQVVIPDTVQIGSLQDVPVWYFAGTWAGNTKHTMDEVGPKVWILDCDSLRDTWKNVPQEGYKIPLRYVPVGTKIKGGGTRYLFQTVFGDLSVDRDTDTFLGEWRVAARLHLKRIADMMSTYPKNRQTEIGLKTATLVKYVESRGYSPRDQVKLADAFLGPELTCEFIRDCSSDSSLMQSLTDWYLTDFLCWDTDG